MSRWDPGLSETRVVERLGDCEIVYGMITVPSMMSKRDTVQKRWVRTAEGSISICTSSVDIPTLPPKKGIVRQTVNLGGFVIRPTEAGCRVFTYSHSDQGMPEWIFKPIAISKMASWIPALHKVLGENHCVPPGYFETCLKSNPDSIDAPSKGSPDESDAPNSSPIDNQLSVAAPVAPNSSGSPAPKRQGSPHGSPISDTSDREGSPGKRRLPDESFQPALPDVKIEDSTGSRPCDVCVMQ